MTADGGIVVVETKLWRNPDARRKVIAQILDYAKELARWDYEDLSREVAKVQKGNVRSLFELVKEHNPSLDEARFIDAVSTNLKYGRFLLVIAGDGIREGVENLTDFLDRLGRLEFTFGLVEVGIYRLPDGPLLFQPRVLAKTMIVRRSVVRVSRDAQIEFEEGGEDEEPRESQPSSDTKFYSAFWQDFLSNHLRLDDKSQPLANPTKSTNIYFPQPPSASQAWISAYFSPHSGEVGVYLRLAKGSYGEAAYQELLADKDAITAELGLEVDWYIPAGRPSISVWRTLTNREDEHELDEIRSFFADAINRFVNAFRPRLERIAKSI
jgi:hypothetical protein